MTVASDFPLGARNAEFDRIVEILNQQQARKYDVIAAAAKISLTPDTSQLVVSGAEAVVDENGVMPIDGVYDPTDVFWSTMSEKLNIPPQYLRRMRTERPDLLAENVNGWLHGSENAEPQIVDGQPRWENSPGSYPPDSRKFMLRLFRGLDGGTGVARAMLSNSFTPNMDHLDVLTAVMGGVRQAGIDVTVDRCDLTERRLFVRIDAPGIKAVAPVLLGNYRSPFDADPGIKRAGGWTLDSARAAAKREGMGFEPGAEPVISAGIIISNSETGDGAYTMVPVLKVGPCRNGLIIDVEAKKKAHLGMRLDEGVIKYGTDTQESELNTIMLRARDNVLAWLNEKYIQEKIAELEVEAGVPISKPMDTVETVTKKLQFSKEEQQSVLQHFLLSGQMNAGGVMNAVTSVAQTIEDPDRAFAVQRAGVPAMKAAAKLASLAA